jgi:cobalt/nickel transport system permease protein
VGIVKMKDEDVPRVGLLSAAFFVASFINIPVGPTSVHLVLNGLIGVILRWRAFPAILVALFLQAVLFQYGGLTTLGVNTFNMAAPAVLVGIIFRRPIVKGAGLAVASSFLAGALAVVLGAALVAASLLISSRDYAVPAGWEFTGHLVLMVVEGLVCATCVGFLRKVKPEILGVQAI